MRTALCLGGADCVFDDVEALDLPFDGVVACNDVGAEWPGMLDAWVTLHPKNMPAWSAKRRKEGRAPSLLTYSNETEHALPNGCVGCGYKFPGQGGSGSSGLFATKVALLDLGFDRAVLAGIPLSAKPHFFDDKAWNGGEVFRPAWLQLRDEFRDRMRSMSGWTRALLGSPADWIAEGSHESR